MDSLEQWRAVPGYEGLYEVSDQGRVRSIDRRARTGNGSRLVKGRVLRQYRRADDRLTVTLSQDDRQTTALVQRLVLTTFAGLASPDAECCHNDGDPTNNALTNLRWDTHQENMRDMSRHGRHYQANKDRCVRGHLLIEPNLKPAQFAKGARSCLSCAREYALARVCKRPFDASLADERYRTLEIEA